MWFAATRPGVVKYGQHLFRSKDNFRINPGETVLLILDCAQTYNKMVLSPITQTFVNFQPKIDHMCVVVSNLSFTFPAFVSKGEKLKSLLSCPTIKHVVCQVDYNDVLHSTGSDECYREFRN